MPTVSATAPATATRRPPSPILTHRLRWRIAAHLVGDEVFTFGRPHSARKQKGRANSSPEIVAPRTDSLYVRAFCCCLFVRVFRPQV